MLPIPPDMEHRVTSRNVTRAFHLRLWPATCDTEVKTTEASRTSAALNLEFCMLRLLFGKGQQEAESWMGESSRAVGPG